MPMPQQEKEDAVHQKWVDPKQVDQVIAKKAAKELDPTYCDAVEKRQFEEPDEAE